jgi:hypothetical protein
MKSDILSTFKQLKLHFLAVFIGIGEVVLSKSVA